MPGASCPPHISCSSLIALVTLCSLTSCGIPEPAADMWLGQNPAWYDRGTTSTDDKPEQAQKNPTESVYARILQQTADISSKPSLDGMIRLAFERNPSLKAARDRYRAAVASFGEAIGLPDPVFMWTTRPDDVETRTGPQTDSFALTQAIPFPGKLALKGDIAEDEARIERERFHLKTRDLIAELKTAFHEITYLDRAIEIVRKTQDLAQAIATKARSEMAENAEVKRDQVTLFDALKAEAQLSQMSYDLAVLLEQREAQVARINRILDRPPAAPVGRPIPLAFRPLLLDRKALFKLTIQNRQELRIALLRTEQAQKERDLADLSFVPDFFLGGQYNVTGSPIARTPDGGQDSVGVTFGITIPLWSGKNSSRIAQAEYRRWAAIRERHDAFNRSLEQVTTIFYRLSNSRRLVALYRDSLIPQARAAMNLSEQWQAAGRDDIGRVLEAQGVWLNFNLALARAQADYQQGLSDLERAVGRSLGAYQEPEDTGQKKTDEKDKKQGGQRP